MKILLIDVNYKHSSTGKIIFDLKKEIEKNGNEAFVAYGRGNNVREKKVFKFGITLETLLDVILTRITGLVGYFSIISTFRLINYIKKIQPDLIHLNEIHSYFLNLPIFYKFLINSRIKVIHTLHNEFVYTGKCWDTTGCDKYKIQCKKCPKLKDYPKSLFFDFTNFMHLEKIRLINRIENILFVSPSNWLQRNFSDSLLSNKECVVIRNGIELQNNLLEKFKLFDDLKIPSYFSKYILFVSSDPFSKNKGGNYIFELAKLNPNSLFLVVGSLTKIKSQQANVKILPRILNSKILFSLYYYFDATLILSKHENLPTVVIESIVYGTPVFGFISKGTKELVNDNIGKLTYYGDIKGLSKLIQDYFLNLNSVIWSKEKIIEFGVSNFSKEKMYSDYMKLYKL
jgi:putative colanic acid biosynthesis glycosyltransferase